MYNMKMKLLMRILLLCFWFQLSFAQNPTTDPPEVRALNSIFEQWDTQPVAEQWNISGEPCSGFAINFTNIESLDINPALVCNCSYDNNATCHITQLRVYALNKRGVFPEEFVALRYLTYLSIYQNYFTGPLPAFIGNMSALTHLSIGVNSFSEPIPKELGNLKELTYLDIGSNNFSGTLPPELGNLVKLEQLYMDSCGLGGEIPSTFANLTNMQVVWASDNPFSGKIPDFIGNWTQLYHLEFQGNSFEGPIPANFSQLTSLEYLLISDIYNGSSSLDFIKNLKSLTDLGLRNALITGTIPSDIGEYQSLKTLDLSFNNLTGQLPSSLFNLSNLTYLFLGNNSLSGPLPSQKSFQLQTIDLSYNFLSGSLPQWVTTMSQLNLVVNNFTFDGSNIALPRLNCLQRNFPCNRNTPRSSFSINCGGQQMTGSDGILYESDDSELGLATFSVTENWAVSNVGLLSDRTSSLNKTVAQVTGTNGTPELLQTSRTSTGSLRYYGLGLKNGLYNVTLHFAETVYESRTSQTWQSLGRRVFDIYIQGTQRTKDFDISKNHVLALYLLLCVVPVSLAQDINLPLKAVNLGNWLLIEGWMKPPLFDGIPNNDLLDGTQVQFKSTKLQKYLAAENGGGSGSTVVVNRDSASGWETFRLWRIDESSFNFRVFNKQFVGLSNRDVVAVSDSPGNSETFRIVRKDGDPNRVCIQASNGLFLQATSETQLTADYGGSGWEDDNPSVFIMTILSDKTLRGEYQITNGYGPDRAPQVLQDHWNSYITEDDFRFLSSNGLDAVRIPVGWWIAKDPSPPKPFVGGSLKALDNAFSWAQNYGMKVIVDLHAVEGSQNGNDHSATRDGYLEWGNSKIQDTVAVIDFLAARYANHPALAAIELMNEPMAPGVTLDSLKNYYKAGYDAVRKYTSRAYVVLSNRLGPADAKELLSFAQGLDRVVVDVHYYSLYSDMFNSFSVQQNIDFIHNQRASDLDTVTTSSGVPLTFVGEWVAEWAINGASKEEYQRFASAQVDVYGRATFGWAYWAYKCQYNHWSLKWMIENNYINLN